MAELATSNTSPIENTTGKKCTVGRLITEAEGQRIVSIAKTWDATPYALAGQNSVKGQKGDCSGSSNKIYVEAGFPYPYQTSKTIVPYIEASHRFRKIAGTPEDPPQPGDLIIWPGGHIAIYAIFAEDDKNSLNKFKKKNNMWSAHYPGGPAYSAERAEGFRKNESFYYYRYFLLPGEPGCS